PCLVKYCGKGRECQVSRGVAECVCQRRCRRHQKLVCGTDGQLYANHCELHRTACLDDRAIAVDHTYDCMKRRAPSEKSEHHNLQEATAPSAVPTAVHNETFTPLQYNPGDNEAEVETDSYYEKDDCSIQEYEIMKDNLLLYNHAKLMAEDNHSSGKEYLVSIMFSHYDQNNNGALEREELEQIAGREHLNQLAKGCSLGHMLSFDDTDKDGRLNINEFYMAFSKLYSVSVVSLDKALEVNHLSARVGDNVEIKCDVTGTPPPPIVWRRNEADLAALNEDEVRVFSDGSLYLTRIQLIHAGNYTCHAQRNKDVVQTHVLTVHSKCHSIAYHASHVCPKISYKQLTDAGQILYCVHTLGLFAATNNILTVAATNNILTVAATNNILTVAAAPNEERRFFSFHDWGVSVYEPTACRLYHQIQATDIIPGTQEYVCGDKGVNCSWGQAINVANRYVYVAQPHKDRVLVISKIQMVVVDVVVTDRYPVELHYVPHLDQVWVLNWRSEHNQGIKTIQIIRDAAQKRKHHTVHPEPIDGQFDLVRGLFMPPIQDMTHMFKYGYVTHTNQRGLYKLDLANMRYTRSIDLTPYNCVPRQIQFSALYGFVIMECEEPITGRPTGQILLDYLTDTVLTHKTGLFGHPHVSPNSRCVVTLDRGRDGVTLVVQEVVESGLKFSFDVKTTLNISDITFYPSQTTHGYDLYASATDKEDILFLNLMTGKVEMITGVGKAMHPTLAQWDTPNRPIAASGVFGHYMVTPANEALFVVNGETRTVNCEIGGLVHPRTVVWVTMQLQ
ncbi:hypothetical protein Cfor_04391, partial [Coptotermes formosanus]